MFLRYIDELTVLHIKLLNLLDSPTRWEVDHQCKFPTLLSGGISHIIENALTELSGQRELYSLLLKDLQNRGLLAEFSIGVTMTWNGIMSSRSTSLGQAFLLYISQPTEH
jgi:hypothetical protein